MAQDKGMPETMICRIPAFMWSCGALKMEQKDPMLAPTPGPPTTLVWMLSSTKQKAQVRKTLIEVRLGGLGLGRLYVEL